MRDVQAVCKRCRYVIEVPGCVLNVYWNCPRCSNANESPVGSATYDPETGELPSGETWG